MKLTLVLALALIAAAVPSFADSGPHANSAHLRAQVYHDHTPHVHDHTPQSHHQA